MTPYARSSRPAHGARAGERLHVESFGSGPPLVLLHGFAMHGGLFAPLLPWLAHRRRVHVVDLPGHGHSHAMQPGSLASIVERVVEALGAAAHGATLLGWSFGGQVALEWARMRPDEIARLILVCTTPSFVTRDHWPSAMAPGTLQRFGDELRIAYRLTLQRFVSLQVQGSDAGRATLATLRGQLFERGQPPAAALAATLQLMVDTDLRSELAAIRAPACVIAGTRDTLAPAAAAEWLAGALPNARYVAIEGAAHAPFLSHASAFEAAVEAFIDGV